MLIRKKPGNTPKPIDPINDKTKRPLEIQLPSRNQIPERRIPENPDIQPDILFPERDHLDKHDHHRPYRFHDWRRDRYNPHDIPNRHDPFL